MGKLLSQRILSQNNRVELRESLWQGERTKILWGLFWGKLFVGWNQDNKAKMSCQSHRHVSRRLKSPSSSYIFERFSLRTCASWPVKRYSELPKTITWELVHLWKNCMKCIVGSMKLHDVISLSLKLLTVCLRIVNFKCQSKRMLSDVLWALQALMFWSFFWNLHRIER